MNYAEALAWLYGTQERGIKLGLDRMRDLLAALGWTQGPECALHVAGTNGKGSVCAMLESICRAAGLRTGLFTSPHLVTFRERIRIRGEMAAKEEIARGLGFIRERCGAAALDPTFFEITTALAFTLFQHAALDVIILEVGLGGRLDSTNVILPRVSVITSIGLDHTHILGGTLAEIAREKAGIIKPGVPVVTGPLMEEAAAVVSAIAAENDAPLHAVHAPLTAPDVALPGEHQRMNAAVALRALGVAGLEVSPAQLAAGLGGVQWPGRFQDTGAGFILDGAHNPAAARTLAETWRSRHGQGKATIILGVLRDKDAAGVCAALAPIAEEFLIVPIRNPRAGTVAELHAMASAHGPARIRGSLAEAISSAPRSAFPVVITGSLFLIGEAMVLLGLAEEEQEISSQ